MFCAVNHARWLVAELNGERRPWSSEYQRPRFLLDWARGAGRVAVSGERIRNRACWSNS